MISRWSHSRLSTYESCPKKAYYRYVEKLTEEQHPAAERGVRIHDLAEKIEKWSVFCKQMDDLRNTPTGNEMRDLRGVVLVALDYFKQLPERTSVNAVINMCKDYCFKRGIWTNQEILDKYQIA